MKKYKLVGLTGTTGSGKSTARKFFEAAGYAVIDADALAREAVSLPQTEVLLRHYFGCDIFHDGALDRRMLAEKAFAAEDKTALLNSVVHPRITPLFLRELRQLSDGGHTKIVFDASQLFESGMDVLCDVTVAVTAPPELRLRRIIGRDNLTEDEARRRISAQFSDEFFAKKCDYVIENLSGCDELRLGCERVLSLI